MNPRNPEEVFAALDTLGARRESQTISDDLYYARYAYLIACLQLAMNDTPENEARADAARQVVTDLEV